jgi:hypothetical protein
MVPYIIYIAIAKLKKYKSPGSDQIPAELIQAGGEILRSKIHELINSIFQWADKDLGGWTILKWILER